MTTVVTAEKPAGFAVPASTTSVGQCPVSLGCAAHDRPLESENLGQYDRRKDANERKGLEING